MLMFINNNYIQLIKKITKGKLQEKISWNFLYVGVNYLTQIQWTF